MKTIKSLAFSALIGLLLLSGPLAHAQSQMYIAISDNSYSNASVTLPVGTTVTWTNTGHNLHTVTADNGAFDSGTLGVNQNFVQTFNTPGVFAYHDRFYGAAGGSGMSGTIIIGNDNGGGLYPICSPSNQNVNMNGQASFTATGGNGNYTWSAPNGSPSFGNGSYFTTSFFVSGTQMVTVSSNGYTGQCTVNVNSSNSGTLSCYSPISTANTNTYVNFNATGGNGSYTWSAGNGNPSYGNGTSFSTQFSNYGNQVVTVNSNGQTAQCSVNIQQNGGGYIGGAPVCSPTTQTANVGNLVTFSATGGNGNYTWSSPALTITNPTGSTFSARFATAGLQTVTVNSNGQSSQCSIAVNGQVLGASTVDTGSADSTLWAIVIGLLTAIIAYGAIFPKYPQKLWKSVAGR